ncbi:MAG: hypothetical protein ABIU54_10980 [Candidatus Eisenbacteria bacterium]
MTLPPLPPAGLAALLALVAAMLLRAVHPARPGVFAPLALMVSLAALAPLAWAVAAPQQISPLLTVLLAALAIALLAREPRELSQTECALKLTWVLGAAFALSSAGDSLLTLATGTAVPLEQWSALELSLDPYALWSAALLMTMLAGLVLLGGAPFHFWPADVIHGTRAWFAPLIVAALQASGAAWLLHRLATLEGFTQGEKLTGGLLSLAALVALVGGAFTLAAQRRPERRVGGLASLQGAIVLAAFSVDPVRAPFASIGPYSLAAWAAHLALALTGAGALAHFLPVSGRESDPPSALARRHPWSAAAAAYALLSLAGAPGTPGAMLWLEVARRLAGTRHPGLLAALLLAWLVAVTVAVNETRRMFGAPTPLPAPQATVPRFARLAFWAVAGGLMALLFVWSVAA